MTTLEMEKAARELKIIRAKQEELGTRAEELEGHLKRAMEEEGVEVRQAGPFRITWKEITSNRFDAKRFKADHLDIYNIYQIASTSRRFQVS